MTQGADKRRRQTPVRTMKLSTRKVFFLYNKGRRLQKNIYDALKDVSLRINMKFWGFRQLSMDDDNIAKPLIPFLFFRLTRTEKHQKETNIRISIQQKGNRGK